MPLSARRPGWCLLAQRWLIVGLALVASVASAASTSRKPAAVPLGDDAGTVHGIDGNVYQVLTGGWWCDGGSQGPYRFVVLSSGRSQTEHNLYLQLLSSDGGRTQRRVAKTVPVIETKQASLFFEDLKLRDGGRCSSVVLEGQLQRRLGEGDRVERLQLKAFQNGDYLATFESQVVITPTPARTPAPNGSAP